MFAALYGEVFLICISQHKNLRIWQKAFIYMSFVISNLRSSNNVRFSFQYSLIF